MPLFFDKEIDTGGRICAWEITESFDELLQISAITKIDSEQIEKKTIKRQLEWMTIRLLLKQLLKTEKEIEIVYDEFGKPHLDGIKKHVSISHTKQFVAVAVHESKNIGIDIEIVAPRIEKIKHKFLSEKESEWANENYSREKLFIIWGAKESVYKIYSEGGIDFKKMLEVNSFAYSAKGTTILKLKKNNVTCAYPVWWENLGGIMLVYSIEN
jgi:4'-phosphopantetheinyl transferase